MRAMKTIGLSNEPMHYKEIRTYLSSVLLKIVGLT